MSLYGNGRLVDYEIIIKEIYLKNRLCVILSVILNIFFLNSTIFYYEVARVGKKKKNLNASRNEANPDDRALGLGFLLSDSQGAA